MFTVNRKFFNIEAPSESVSAGQSIASLMASHGVKSESGMTVEIPSINIGEPKVEPIPTTTPEPVATTTTEEPKVEEAKLETPPPPTEQAIEPTPQIAEPQIQVPSWQEVLKNQQPNTVLKELGYDEQVVSLAKEIQANPQMIAFYQHWKEKGEVTDYLRELSTDYSRMPAEEVMRHQLRQEYPKANERQLEILFNQKVVNQYRLNSDDEVEVEEGRLLLEAEADKFRDNLVSNQQKYLLPKSPEPSQPEVNPNPQEDAERQRQQEVEAYKSAIDNHQYTKSLFTNNAITVGEGGEQFNFPVNPNVLKEALVDADKWAQHLFVEQSKPDGTKEYIPDVEKQILLSAIAVHGKKFINDLAQHFKTIGGKAALAPIENAKPPEGSMPTKSEGTPTSAAEAMARSGRLV